MSTNEIKSNKTPEQQAEHKPNCAQLLRAAIIQQNAAPVYIIEKNSDYRPLLGCPNYFVFLETVYEELKQEGFSIQAFNDASTPVIIRSNPGSLDNSNKAVSLCRRLQAAGVTVYRQDSNAPFEPIKCSGLDAIRQEIIKQYQDYFSAAGSMFEFDNVIKSNANTPAINTGFSQFDKILDGGLYEGLYTIGAISSLGKTTFCENIADQIAKAGHDVIIISLEMSKFELISKSISRLTFVKYLNEGGQVKYEYCKTARGITDGSRYTNYTEAELDLIQQAKAYYFSNIGRHLFIYEAIGSMNELIVREIIKRHIENTGNRPIVIIDYLQLLQNSDKYINSSDKQRADANVSALKRISRDYKIPVIAISSVNRMSYDSEITFASFKESGGIEFSSDVVIGLQLAGVGRADFNVNQAKAKDPREIELVMLKNRQAKTGDKLKFYYYPMFNHFMEIEGE